MVVYSLDFHLEYDGYGIITALFLDKTQISNDACVIWYLHYYGAIFHELSLVPNIKAIHLNKN